MGNIINFLLGTGRRNSRQRPEESQFCRRAFRAARKGDLQTLKEMMEWPTSSGFIPLANIADPQTGETLLHAAMVHGSADCIRFLINVGCQVTQGDHSMETPLHVACMHDNVEGISAALELEEDVDLNITDMWQRTLLLKAMVYNSHQVLQMLFALSVNLNAQDVDGLSMAHLAASYDRLDILHILAAKGASLNLLNDKARSPLSLAIVNRSPDMVRELLFLGANTYNPKSTQPVIFAVSELIRRFEGGVECERAEQVLHLMLAAHGFPLHSGESDVFLRVLYTADVKRFLPLLHKMHVCSDSPFDDLFRMQSASSQQQQTARNSGPQPRTPVSLFDLARRSARSALMTSGRNVVWAVARLQSCVPPAVKGLLLLKDCDHKEFSLSLVRM